MTGSHDVFTQLTGLIEYKDLLPLDFLEAAIASNEFLRQIWLRRWLMSFLNQLLLTLESFFFKQFF